MLSLHVVEFTNVSNEAFVIDLAIFTLEVVDVLVELIFLMLEVTRNQSSIIYNS